MKYWKVKLIGSRSYVIEIYYDSNLDQAAIYAIPLDLKSKRVKLEVE